MLETHYKMRPVAANGVSSVLSENSKLDGLSVSQLHEYITDKILENPVVALLSEKPSISTSTLRELTFEIPYAVAKAIEEQTAHNLAHYKPLGSFRRGYVEPLYPLMCTALGEGEPLPPLFASSAWQYCDRNLTPKRAKTDCLGPGGYMRMQEAGFMMLHPNSLFIHYELHHPDPLILVQGRENDVARFEVCLNEAITVVQVIIEGGLSGI